MVIIKINSSAERVLGVLSSYAIPIHSLLKNIGARMSSRISAFMKLPHLASAKCWYEMLTLAALPIYIMRTHKNQFIRTAVDLQI